ncbi:hypothetical protein AACH10_13900 [Ideonella sp. DXS22W]|uniref:DUF4760 domain-containing protein n=1 Tax=Pseudaquabacterium inlustre TaxID=2984192 RepID=A0ABU9CHL1_9BURK
MEILQFIAPLLGVIVGAILTGLTSAIRMRRERRRVIAIALADLLEVRHRIYAIDAAIKEIGALANIPAETISTFRNQLESILPDGLELNKRYDAAVTTLAGIDPILGFRLRSKNLLPGILNTARALAASTPDGLQGFEQMESRLRSAAIPKMNAAVFELAKAHSYITAFKVWRLINQAEAQKSEATKIFGDLIPQQNRNKESTM